MPTITLICAHDNHPWEREVQRGKRPKYCPDHRPEPAPTIAKANGEDGAKAIVTLICAHDGHTWERESQRGKRPKYCPEHKPQTAPTARTFRSSADPIKPQSPRPQKSPKAAQKLLERAYEVLPEGDSEELRKVDSCARDIRNGRHDDMDLIEQCLKEIIRRARRQAPTPVPMHEDVEIS